MLSALSTLARLIGADIRLVATEVVNTRRSSPTKVELNGVVLTLGPWAVTPIRNGIRSGSYEREERAVALATVRPTDVVLELGPGCGYLTTIVAGIAASVRAFEANPDMAAVARTTVSENGRDCTITNGVVSRDCATDTVPFYISPHFAESSLSPIHGAQVVDVPLFDFAEALSGCTYLIVDIEGAEVDLLPGELPGIERICVECHPSAVGVAKTILMVDSLREQGFAVNPGISQGQVIYLER